jgi:hypothetical protein
MIQITAYLRNEEDYTNWKAIGNKTEFLHNALSTAGAYKALKPAEKKRVKELVAAFVPSAPDPELGYPCCQKRVPCKHWAFDGIEGLWKNELTGKTREI